MKTSIAALILAATVGTASADVLVIDDDRHYWEPERPSVGYTVDIDDDGWTRVENVSAGNRGPVGNSGTCTQMEMSAGVPEAVCGTLDLSEITRLKDLNESSD